MQKLRGKIYIYLAAMLLLFFVILSTMGGASAFADVAASPRSGTGSDVLADLQADKSFNAADYPVNSKDYSLQVIQIAESKQGELLVYVYQPSSKAANLRATTVRISQEIGDNAKWHDYPLTFLNASDVFYKYQVNDIKIKPDNVRYYDITAIHRKWNINYDGPTGSSTINNEIVFTVGQRWTVTTTESGVEYSANEIEVVKILTERPGFIRYSNGWGATNYSYLDSHYLAFTCDHKIDLLLNVDLEFKTQTYKKSGNNYTYGEPEPHAVTLYDYETTGIYGQGVFKDNAEWHKISRVADFINEVGDNLSKSDKKNLANYDWVLSFYETGAAGGAGWGDLLLSLIFPPAGIITSAIHSLEEGVITSEVTIMRMMFEYGGKIYNLGVVDNKTTFNRTSGGTPWWVWVLVAAGITLFLCIISKTARKIVWFVIKVVTFPLWLPFWLIHRKRKERKRKQERARQRADKQRQRKEQAANVKAKITDKFKRKPKVPAKEKSTDKPAQTSEPAQATPKKSNKPKERIKENAKKGPRKGKTAKDTPRRDN